MSSPRIEIDLDKIEQNTRTLVDRLGARGISVTGVTKATLGSSGVGAAMMSGGAVGVGDSRVENLSRLSVLDPSTSRTLIRSPMLSQAGQVVRAAHVSLHTDQSVLRAVDRAAKGQRRTHDIVLMVELGDLREGILVEDVPDAVRAVQEMHGLRLVGVGANLACQSGVVPDDTNMGTLSALAERLEEQHRLRFAIVSGGNSANIGWALETRGVGRINNLRLGEAILLGLDPLHRTPIDGLHTDAFRLIGEVIEVAEKPARPWGDRAQSAFGEAPVRSRTGTIRQGIVALGRQDVELDGLRAPQSVTVLGMSSDHLVLDLGDQPTKVGDELTFGVGYGALVRAMTSPFVTKVERTGLPVTRRLTVVPKA